MACIDHLYCHAIEEMRQVTTRAGCEAALQWLVEHYDFLHVAYFASHLPKGRIDQPYVLTTYPAEWIDHYRSEHYQEVDPVLSVGFASLLPVDWRQLAIIGPRQKQLFSQAEEYGLGRQGLTVPIRGLCGERALLTLTAAASDREWDERCRWLMRDFQSLAYHFHDMVLRVEAVHNPEIDLAPREVECLRWAGQGKTAAEIGIILSISERTAQHYINQAKQKLNATNVTHAATKATQLSGYYMNRKTR
ncbi:LuxR family transcriptional regulator [Rhizobium sp. SSA_523]|uniref:LuxR family transcriptional regulator n=1 Tax=Rhizobium sp. SSA_523 TaxID=2952477 RepID=UPI0020918E6F|nr:LuxR family transcriptional regulator [Rhizobium sp. SSA_523]MCO5732172.1 LuxR family transcriptional regulator [Rhizobium sp. SSA_523]WKC21413.1 LuxR family transcriptional regulator [Rhizobium sp. SSA_523]